MTELKKKEKKSKPCDCVNTASPCCYWAKKGGNSLNSYRNSDHIWMCTCISWQESEVVLEMLLSWCDGMLKAPCLLLDTKAKQYTSPQLESISLQVPNTQSIRGQFLSCLTFLLCTEGSLVFVYRFPYQTANSIRSKSSSDYPGFLSCSAHLLVREKHFTNAVDIQ